MDYSLISREEVPLRLLILHLLYTLGRNIPSYPDIYGIRPNLEFYLQQIKSCNDFMKRGYAAELAKG